MNEKEKKCQIASLRLFEKKYIQNETILKFHPKTNWKFISSKRKRSLRRRNYKINHKLELVNK
jgi:hypothetical protein